MTLPRIGFTCAYAPVALIQAAGFIPYRIFPESQGAEQAGLILHDNLCPHVKRVLDRALNDELPDLEALVIMNSCDAMRRLADAWKVVKPDIPVYFLELPVTSDKLAVDLLTEEFLDLQEFLGTLNSTPVSEDGLRMRIKQYNQLCLLRNST